MIGWFFPLYSIWSMWFKEKNRIKNIDKVLKNSIVKMSILVVRWMLLQRPGLSLDVSANAEHNT